MNIKNNICKPEYDRSILSISSSIMKHYGVKSNYSSLNELDIILKNNYKNVIFLILDCLGTKILENNLSEKSILKTNLVTNVTSVFPPTTAAATSAIHSGLSPLENGWIGWMPYIKEHNRMIELFTGKDFYTKEKIFDVSKSDITYETIYEKICDANKNINFHKVFSAKVDADGVTTFEELCDRIKDNCNNESRNLISAYWIEPDHTIHYNGINSNNVKEVIGNIDKNLQKLIDGLENSVIVITADHGAVDVKEIYINEIKEIDDCLALPPSIESRFVSFFIKKGMKNKFKNALKKYFKDKYILYTKQQFLNEGLLGKGEQHKRINDYLGDYILIINSELNIRYSLDGKRDNSHLADHGGITADEMLVPLIVLETGKNK